MAIILTLKELSSLSRIGALHRTPIHQILDPGKSASLNADLTLAQQLFLEQFESKVSYFLHEFLPAHLEGDLDVFYMGFTLFDKRILHSTVSKTDRKVTVIRSFEAFGIRPSTRANVAKLKTVESRLNALLKLAFEGANIDAKFKYHCDVIIESDQLVFSWRPI